MRTSTYYIVTRIEGKRIKPFVVPILSEEKDADRHIEANMKHLQYTYWKYEIKSW